MSDDKPRTGADVEDTFQKAIGDLGVPGRVPKVTAERVRDAADSAIKRSERDGAVGRAFGRAS